MNLFLTLIAKLLPIYALIGVGFFAGRKLEVSRDVVARLLIYIIAPVVVFNAVYTTPLVLKTFALPGIFMVLCSLIAVLAYIVNKNVNPAGFRGILAFTSGDGNTGYFGLPVAIALFGEHMTGLAVLCAFGFIIYENTVGFFLAARGKHSSFESFVKLVKLPALYAFLLGIIIQVLHIHLPQTYAAFVPNFRGAYVLLGSLIIGVALSEFERAHAQWGIIIRTFTAKFVVWPTVISALILLDKHLWHIYSGNPDYYRIAFLMSIVPLAANTVAFASFLKSEPQRAAFAVFASTIFALAYIPIMASLVLPRLLS